MHVAIFLKDRPVDSTAHATMHVYTDRPPLITMTIEDDRLGHVVIYPVSAEQCRAIGKAAEDAAKYFEQITAPLTTDEHNAAEAEKVGV